MTFSGPAGPTDTALSFIALCEPAGRSLAVYCAYSLHYAGVPALGAISADYPKNRRSKPLMCAKNR